MAAEAQSHELVRVVALLAAGVVAVPVFKRLGLGSVLGYLAAGLAIGPFGLKLFADPQAILHVAELGVVMFLFVIGLEMRPTHLWSLRRQIFGLGTLQIGACTATLTAVGLAFGFPLPVSFIGAAGFMLTSTAIVMQLLGERGDLALPRGQKIVSVLLFEDLLVVPLLALVAFMSPQHAAAEGGGIHWASIGIAVASLAGLVAAGLWLLNPMFRMLAEARAREVMTAAALLVVLGAALLMEVGGLSMAMGAFLAGVLLSESTFRHQLEADIEPFRGILLGLFFLSVGMALDLAVVARNATLIVAGVLALMSVKAVTIYAVARLLRSTHAEALDRAVLMAQGGEFAFVLFAAAHAGEVIDADVNANLTAIVVLSMALTPLAVTALKRFGPREAVSMDGIDQADGLTGTALMIGFGRFGQVASQALLARGIEVAIIDSDTEMIRSAADFGFKVYYGDGTRLDVLQASGARTAQAILVCVDDRGAASRIVELVRHEFPQARLLVRAYDREHALKLMEANVDYFVRETFESASHFGERALRLLGVGEEEAAQLAADVRRRDLERLELQFTGGIKAGRDLMHSNRLKPQPLTAPQHPGQALSAETAEVTQTGGA
ncbi:monovalent cation:proton antiporter-2 (CPA2) family protein [Sinimarinibacterium flocculans]|uniref:Kef-type potassium/proton antiporter (CPA2 family) n=1 Tax=Sinimarinibacterium flocculans TaxID=985250 RepID=A0A318EFQ2_9GAMM|nr:monovalent cation:proton antiporter-2 (CPA2) family protein [Sinimarinibacterium flocculans]PXV67049.1 Kef-type potassium/proton antiporter (CPA2 family) [Sinimarinibacterium flocculans]